MPRRGSIRRALTTSAVVVFLTTAATGCTSNGAATPTSNVPASTTAIQTSPPPTPSVAPATPTVPVPPEAMQINDEQGAVAAAKYFVVDLYDYVYASRDLTEWRTMSDPGCGFCNTVASEVESLSEPLTVEAGASEVVSSMGSTITEGARYTATLVVVQPQGTGDASALKFEFHFAIAWTDGWRILAVDVSQATE